MATSNASVPAPSPALINTLRTGVTLTIVNAQGKKDSINIQPKGRVSLPAGWSLDPNRLKEYEAYILNIPKPN